MPSSAVGSTGQRPGEARVRPGRPRSRPHCLYQPTASLGLHAAAGDPADVRLAERVKAAARACPTGRYGDNKVFIAHVWRSSSPIPTSRGWTSTPSRIGWPRPTTPGCSTSAGPTWSRPWTPTTSACPKCNTSTPHFISSGSESEPVMATATMSAKRRPRSPRAVRRGRSPRRRVLLDGPGRPLPPVRLCQPGLETRPVRRGVDPRRRPRSVPADRGPRGSSRRGWPAAGSSCCWARTAAARPT